MGDLSTRCHRDQVVLQQIIQQLKCIPFLYVSDVPVCVEKKTHTIWIHPDYIICCKHIHRYLISH